MKYLKKYNLFENKKKEKEKEKIKKFFNVDYIIKKSLELNTKLSIWIINSYKQWLEKTKYLDENIKFMKNNDITFNNIKNYLKTGKTNNNKIKEYVYNNWKNFSPVIQYILDWINSFDYKNLPPEKRNITKLTFDKAYEKSEIWHNSLIAGNTIEDEHGKILMTFPDGFYWINLETTNDRCEADAMGHCGRTNKGNTLYSLRDRNHSPHITVAVDEENGIIYQMKGRNNKKPIKKYHPYIVDLLINNNLEYPLKGFGFEYDNNNDFQPSDLDPILLKKLKEKRPNIDDPVFSTDEINDMFNNMIESYYLQDNEYVFSLVKWLYEISNLDNVIDCMNDKNDTLFNILCKEFPNKVEKHVRFGIKEEEIKNKIMLDVASTYINPNDIANKYNISLSNPKDSPVNKWNEIYKYIGSDELKSILKDNDVFDKYEYELKEKYPEITFKSEFLTHPYAWDKSIQKYDIEDLLNHFLGYNEKIIIEKLGKLFDESESNNNYWNEIDNVFDLNLISMEIQDKLTTEQKENELANYSWYEYTNENDW